MRLSMTHCRSTTHDPEVPIAAYRLRLIKGVANYLSNGIDPHPFHLWRCWILRKAHCCSSFWILFAAVSDYDVRGEKL